MPPAGPDLALELAAAGAPAPAPPADLTLVFKTTWSRLKLAAARTALAWHHDPATQRFDATWTTTALGANVLEMTSTGRIEAFGLAPERFTDKRVRRAMVAANLDWSARKVTYSARSIERPLREGMQDRISWPFQLMLYAQRLPHRFEPGALVDLPVTGPGDTSVYRFAVTGAEALATDLGELQTVKLMMPKSAWSEASVEVWLEPLRAWAPVRIRLVDRNDDIWDSVLTVDRPAAAPGGGN
jgi:hypothetical protein